MIGVVVPTVPGREESLQRTLESLRAPNVTVWIGRGYTRCGLAWNAGAQVFLEIPEVEYVCFCADDLTARPGWSEEAIEVADRGELPAARIYFQGEWWSRADGKPGEATTSGFPRVPFFSRELLERCGECPPLHYYSDVWYAAVAAHLGIVVRVCERYAFDHAYDEAAPGRIHDAEPDRLLYERERLRIAERLAS